MYGHPSGSFTDRRNESEDGLDSQNKQWRSTAIRARAKRQGPLIGAIILFLFVAILITCADKMDTNHEHEIRTRDLDAIHQKEKLRGNVAEKIDAAFLALQTAQKESKMPAEKNENSIIEKEHEDFKKGSIESHIMLQLEEQPEQKELKRRAEQNGENPRNEASENRMRRLDRLGVISERQSAIVEAIEHAWSGYRQHAWGRDELLPLSRDGKDWCYLGLTMVDSLDLMWLIGDDQGVNDSIEWIQQNFYPNVGVSVNVFEVTIRVLGGLLSGHFFTGSQVLLDKAVLLGESLAVAFDTNTGIPFSDVKFGIEIMEEKVGGGEETEHSKGFNPHNGPSSLAEAGSVQLEFSYLAKVSFNDHLRRQVRQSNDALAASAESNEHAFSKTNLLPLLLNPNSGKFTGSKTISLGARGDSYYEYLLKQWLLTDRTDEQLLHRYRAAVDGILNHLVSSAHGFTYVGEWASNNLSPKMDHLVCFLPGTLALGHYMGADQSVNQDHLTLAIELLETCLYGYQITESKLAPEIWWFRQSDGPYIKDADGFSLLRPETVESLYYLWKVTHDNRWRDSGWEIFTSFNQVARVPPSEGVAFSSMSDVTLPDGGPRRDSMESFFIAETLKYLFLLFDDQDLLPLDEVVFNTEAHPFPVFQW